MCVPNSTSSTFLNSPDSPGRTSTRLDPAPHNLSLLDSVTATRALTPGCPPKLSGLRVTVLSRR